MRSKFKILYFEKIKIFKMLAFLLYILKQLKFFCVASKKNQKRLSTFSHALKN